MVMFTSSIRPTEKQKVQDQSSNVHDIRRKATKNDDSDNNYTAAFAFYKLLKALDSSI